jgi:AcrR family transcriptional regulator
MSIAERKERQRAERYELILVAARELAEAEGWDAVTTRRLAELINYSQPVLYSHFKGKADIMAAVATRGFEELATRLKMETANVTGAPDGCLRGDVRLADKDQIRQRGDAASSSRRLRGVGRRTWARSARASISG